MKTSDFSRAKVGDLAWSSKTGWGAIEEIRDVESEEYPITHNDKHYTLSGKHFSEEVAPSLFREVPDCFKEFATPKPPDFTKGQKVLVRDDSTDAWTRAYFSHVSKCGKTFFCFANGSEQCSGGRTEEWLYCRRYEELNEEPCEFYKNQLVLARNSEDEPWVKKQFSHFSKGEFYCFFYGDEWSSEGDTIRQKYCKAAD